MINTYFGFLGSIFLYKYIKEEMLKISRTSHGFMALK